MIANSRAASRTLALIQKESLQVVRDPSALLIAFILPVVMLFLFAYAVSLDIQRVKIGVVLESDTPKSIALASYLGGTRYFEVHPARSAEQLGPRLVSGELKGYVLIPANLEQRVSLGNQPLVQIITDASQPNTANFVAGYAQGAVQRWFSEQPSLAGPRINIEARYWYNPSIDSRQFLIPGAIGIIMTMIGTLLTALVMAREWERGTMEALLSTPARVNEIIIGKVLPYFVLGMLASTIAAVISLLVFGIPLRGSLFALLIVSAVFMLPALGQGLVISVVAKNQFIASQLALLSGFLPAFLLSGFLFEIDSMPQVIQYITNVVAAKYYISSLQTIFLVGDEWSTLLPNVLYMGILGVLFLGISRVKTRRSLES